MERHPPDNPLYRGKRLVGHKYLGLWSVSGGTLPHSHIRQSGDVSQATAVRRHASNDRDEQQIFTWYVYWLRSPGGSLQERRDLGLDNPAQRCTSDPRHPLAKCFIPHHPCRRRK
ncbi:hypothetical protein SCLCIDRAFT_1223547 [Scleroderma citrinum Foug A]|uniref:Uncharacterized protein n=1 Tax=Scleroderma citrinum Foug A TaxID=1036808 RepID=A0A0C3D8B3_9AGAM|nr:hypothetical protein SCLCIDRAFT_1223547 [Scleroderma citrinum Foug A]